MKGDNFYIIHLYAISLQLKATQYLLTCLSIQHF